MHYNNFKEQNSIYFKKYENMINANNPYRAQNMIILKTEIPKQNEVLNEKTPTIEKPPISETTPIKKVEPTHENVTTETQPKVYKGYISVGVFTALGALPVPDAVVTIYSINEKGDENAIYQLITDENGRIPDVELPVIYNPNNPLVSSEFYFTTYNMRIQAINYYTVNVLEIRVFPNITTAYRIDLIPVRSGTTTDNPEQIIIIPSSPIDKSND